MAYKIIFLVKDFRTGGVERLLLELMGVPSNLKPQLWIYGEIKTTFIHELDKNKGSIRFFKRSYDILWEFNNLEKRDEYIIYSFLTPANILGSILSFIYDIKLITTIHLYPHSFEREDIKRKLFRPLIYKFMLLNSYKCICVSNGVRDGVKKLVGPNLLNKLEVIYNPVIGKNFKSKSEFSANECHSKYEGDYITACGRLSYQKGFDILIKSFYELVKINSQIKLIIIGDGELKNDLLKLIEQLNLTKKVFITGYLNNPLKIIRKSKVFVLSSRYEGLGNVLIEALALNVPCVSFNCDSGPSDILNNGEFGLLVENGSINKLTASILLQINNPLKYNKISFKKHLENFMSDTVFNRYLKIAGVNC